MHFRLASVLRFSAVYESRTCRLRCPHRFASYVAGFVNAEYLNDGRASVYCDVVNPSRVPGVATRAAVSTNKEVDDAVVSACIGFQTWSGVSARDRGFVLRSIAGLLRENASKLGRLDALETGKPIRDAEGDVRAAADIFDYYGGLAASHASLGTFSSRVADAGDNHSFVYVRREPIGVCAAIGTWNYPTLLLASKVAPALACGNSVVYKPSEKSPSSAVLLAELAVKFGHLHHGAFNVVLGGGDVGSLLASHPAVGKVSITGSVPAGIAVGRAAFAIDQSRDSDGRYSSSHSLKRLTLELGGKSALIIVGDADIDKAADVAIAANFYNNGQVCSNGTRVFVQKSAMLKFLEAVARKVHSDVLVGDPMDSDVTMGPLIGRDSYERATNAVNTAVAAGARVVTGGAMWAGVRVLGSMNASEAEPGVRQVGLARGYFFPPTVLANCKDDMPVVRDELFAPVMSVLEFDTIEEAVRRSNDTPYGLAAGIFTESLTTAHSVAAALKCGVCYINGYNAGPAEMPFGGTKMSGVGRENGLAAIDEYTTLKSVHVSMPSE